jgi:hypothetical protein
MNEISARLLQAYLIATNHKLERHSAQVEALVETLKGHSPELYAKYEDHLRTLEKHRIELQTSEPQQYVEVEDQLIELLRELVKNSRL